MKIFTNFRTLMLIGNIQSNPHRAISFYKKKTLINLVGQSQVDFIIFVQGSNQLLIKGHKLLWS